MDIIYLKEKATYFHVGKTNKKEMKIYNKIIS